MPSAARSAGLPSRGAKLATSMPLGTKCTRSLSNRQVSIAMRRSVSETTTTAAPRRATRR